MLYITHVDVVSSKKGEKGYGECGMSGDVAISNKNYLIRLDNAPSLEKFRR